MTLARMLVRRFRDQLARPLPATVEAAATLHLLDAIGVGLAAAGSEAGKAYQGLGSGLARGGPASVFGQVRGASGADAALINGGLIHSLEYDDTHTASIVHGSAVLAASALAAAEAAEASGRSILSTYACGWEILVRMGLAAPGGFQSKGFQVTSVAGALVAALIAAELAGLSEDVSVAAVGIALSQASGVFEFLTNGSSVKSLHPGWAAHSGLMAARLAASGMTGPETALEGRFGLFAIFAADREASARFGAQLEDFGERWHLRDAAYKFYPCCHYIHPFIEAAGKLADQGISGERIKHLLCRVPMGAAQIICDPWTLKQAPATAHAARWSLPYAVAARLVEGTVDLSTFEKLSPQALTLSTRIAWEALPDARFPQTFEAELVCKTQDGLSVTVRVEDVYGNSSRPARPEEVRQKFRRNAMRSLAEPAVTALERAVEELSAASSLTSLTEALRDGACVEEMA